MLKVRITYTNDIKGKKERDTLIAAIEKDKIILDTSKEYKGRGQSKFNNIYLTVE